MDIEVRNPHWELFLVRRGFETVQPLYDLIQGRGYIAGSYAAFMAAPGDTPILPNDIDVFATSTDHAAGIVHDWRARFGGAVDENDVVFTITQRPGLHAIQVVKPSPQWKDFPGDLLDTFDLDISRAVLVSPNTVMADANVGLRQGKLLRIHNPLRCLKRVLKYHDRGVEFTDHELLKLFQAWELMEGTRRAELIGQAQPAPHDFEDEFCEDEFEDEAPEYAFDWDHDDWFDGE